MTSISKTYDDKRYKQATRVGKQCDKCKWSVAIDLDGSHGYRLGCTHPNLGEALPIVKVRAIQGDQCGESALWWEAK